MVLTAGALAACGTTPAGASAGNSDPPRTSGASNGTPSGSSSSTGLDAALAGIDPAKLPSTAAAVADVLAKLPAMVNGHPVTHRTGKRVIYADGSDFLAQPLVEAVGPGMSMAQAWARLGAGHPGDFTVTSHSKSGEPVLWARGTGLLPGLPGYLVAVASPSGSWIFAIDATSEEAENDLVTGFLAALR